MAEAFGVATGAFAVFTLTLELLKIVKSAHRSMKLTQNVLEITSEIKIGLSITEKLLNEIEALSADAANDCGVSMCLERCRPRLKVLKEILQDISETNSSNRKKAKRALRMIAYDKRLSEASGILKETIDCLSLGLLVFQLYESRMQSIKLSTMNEKIAWIAAQQTKEVSSFALSNDVQNSIDNLSQSLALLEVTINQPSLSNAKVSPEKLVGSSRSLGKLHFGDASKSAISATLTDDKLATNRLQSLPHKSNSQMDTTEHSLGYHNGSTFLKASEIYSITHQRFNLLLGTMIIAYMRKRHRGVRKEEKNNCIQSWEVKITFSSSWRLEKGFLARLWTNASGGYNLQQSLTVIDTVPSSDEIWNVFRCMDIVSVRKEFMSIRKAFMKGKYSVNTVDEYGRSFLSKACRRGLTEMAGFLLDAGAISQGVDDQGRNALVYGFDICGPFFLGTNYWAIYNLLVDRCQLDPSEPDWNGRNFWHLLCENFPSKKEFSWQSICNDFRYVLNERDDRGRTSTFILSSNPNIDTEILCWHLNNKASLSITQIDGLTCLHAAIASLEPQHEIYHITAEDLAGYPGMKITHDYNDEHSENQRKKIELLIRKGANIFTASNQYGTPTDIARLTGNFSLWIEALRNSGFDPTRVLAADKKVLRHQQFLSRLQLARNLQRQRRLRWQILQNILTVLEIFDKDKKYTTEMITPEWSCLPIYPFVACMGTYQEILSILKRVIRNAIWKDDYAEDQGQVFSLNGDIGGKYQTGFLHRGKNFLTASPLYQERYNSLDEYLETLAKIASGDHTFNAGTIDCETHRLYIDVIKAAATVECNCRSWLLPQRTGSMHAPESAKESLAKMPGSWPV